MIPCFRLLMAAAVCAVATGPIYAGPVFDDLLNTMVIDQSLQRSGDDNVTITSDKPYGQTFVTGDKVARLCRIALHVAYWTDTWQPGESLVCTLWDSPAKKTKLGSSSITYERRQWHEGILMFYVESPVQPNTEYYFEMTVDGGDGKIAGILLAKGDYPKGRAYEAGKPQDRDIWFETHVKRVPNRDEDYAGFFDDFNLDYKGMEKIKSAVATKNWDTACKEFLTYFEAKKDFFGDIDATPKLDPKFDTTEGDLAADQKWRADGGSIIDLGPNWNYFATWPTYGGIGLTRTGLMKPIAFTYTKTGNEKYARAWNDMLISMFRNVPCPLKSGVVTTDKRIGPLIGAGISGCLWDSISLAARIHHETFYNRFRNSPLFTADARMGWWMNVTDMVNTLSRMDAGGNWTTQNTTSLFGFAQKYPEYKKSAEWFKQGFDGIKQNFFDNMFADGPCREATTNYHSFSLQMFFGTFSRARDLGIELPKDLLQRLENSFQYTMYTTQPDWQLPIWGDTNRTMEVVGLVKSGGDFFHRDDMLWVGTKGKQGKKPEHTSIAFSDSGYYIMRSGWDPEARFLVTRNGFSQSHYHPDQLSIIVNAYGVDLLPDPGIYIYGTPESDEMAMTREHSNVCVDDKDISQGAGESVFTAQPGFDYYRGTAPIYRGIKEVLHTRSIVFLKPDYWVVADWVKGPGEHTVDQRWRFAPGTAEMDSVTGISRSTNAKGGNIEIIPLFAKGAKSELTQNVFCFQGTSVGKAPVALHERKGALPVAFCTVLYPYPAGSKPTIKAEELTCSDSSLAGDVMGTKITNENSVDYVVFDKAGKEASFNGGGMVVLAESAVVRTNVKAGKVTGFSWYAGQKLSIGKNVLASSSAPVKSLDVSYAKGIVTINAEDAGASLSVATLGATDAMVNGKHIILTKGTKAFQPFAGTL